MPRSRAGSRGRGRGSGRLAGRGVEGRPDLGSPLRPAAGLRLSPAAAAPCGLAAGRVGVPGDAPHPAPPHLAQGSGMLYPGNAARPARPGGLGYGAGRWASAGQKS